MQSKKIMSKKKENKTKYLELRKTKVKSTIQKRSRTLVANINYVEREPY